MKDLQKRLIVIAFGVVIGIVLCGCENSTGSDGKTGKNLIMGKFADHNAGIDATFYADIVSARSARNTTAGGQELTGKIEDGDIIFNLSGVYYSANGSFVLSAGSSILIYEISGILTNSGLSQTEAAIKVNSGGSWITHIIMVTSVNDVTITGLASDQQSDGLPSTWMGSWTLTNERFEFNNYPCIICNGSCAGHGVEFDSTFIITPFSMTNTYDEGISFPVDILELVKINDTKFDLIVQGIEGVECDDYPCGRDDCCYEDLIFVKIRLEQINPNLIKLMMPVSLSGNVISNPNALANARAVNIDNIAELIIIDLFR